MVYPPPARVVLRLNAVLSFLTGLVLLIAAPTVARIMGFDEPQAYGWTGVLLMLFGAGSAAVSTLRGINRQRVLPFALADLGWVALCLGVLVVAPEEFTATGRALIGGTAAMAAWFAMAELRAARKL